MASPKLAVIYYSSTGNTHAMAEAVAEGGNPYGASATGTENGRSEAELAGAKVTGQRVATVASWILKGRS